MAKPTIEDKNRAYYDATAARYDEWHGFARQHEHHAALVRNWPLVSHLSVESVLDVGCGTGASLDWISRTIGTGAGRPVRLAGLDLSEELLNEARGKLPKADLRLGDAHELPFEDAAFDVVLATGILHHVESPKRVIREMFRVAEKAVIISDHNNFAFGSDLARRVRLGLMAVGLLRAFTFAKQGFRRQGYSEQDGWWYPYSLLDSMPEIEDCSSKFFLTPTRKRNSRGFGNFGLVYSHVAIVGFK